MLGNRDGHGELVESHAGSLRGRTADKDRRRGQIEGQNERENVRRRHHRRQVDAGQGKAYYQQPSRIGGLPTQQVAEFHESRLDTRLDKREA